MGFAVVAQGRHDLLREAGLRRARFGCGVAAPRPVPRVPAAGAGRDGRRLHRLRERAEPARVRPGEPGPGHVPEPEADLSSIHIVTHLAAAAPPPPPRRLNSQLRSRTRPTRPAAWRPR